MRLLEQYFDTLTYVHSGKLSALWANWNENSILVNCYSHGYLLLFGASDQHWDKYHINLCNLVQPQYINSLGLHGWTLQKLAHVIHRDFF